VRCCQCVHHGIGEFLGYSRLGWRHIGGKPASSVARVGILQKDNQQDIMSDGLRGCTYTPSGSMGAQHMCNLPPHTKHHTADAACAMRHAELSAAVGHYKCILAQLPA
jgi:hypothetical protein